MNTTKIKTNEVLLKEDGRWLHFSQPQHIITAQNLDDVIPALQKVEKLIDTDSLHAAGFVSYEAAASFDKALITHSGTERFPYLWFGLFPSPRVVALPELDSAKEALSSWLPTIDRETYNAAIQQIKDCIAGGRTYQVNFTMRLRTEFKSDPWNFFLHLAQTQNNHAAYVDTGRYVIASASPELFFQLDGETITSRPMKGTAKRGHTTLEDKEKAEWLHNSEKNRAENIMIVDMIRNDMGRIARIGSVHVPELFTAEKYPTLWQMTSTVQAKTNASLIDIFKALFPCASITGAPKVSTMRIISELESTPRRIYTGTIGHIAPNRKATFNVAIRTALIDRETQTAEYGVGGGIVWDSTSTDEYTEALLKARILTEDAPQFSLLETMLWTPEEGFFLRDKHIARLLDSAGYFGYKVSEELIRKYLANISSQFTSPQRMRLLLDKHGNLTHEVKPLQQADVNSSMKICLSKGPINSTNVFLFHKTTHRDMYNSARKDFPDYDDVLLYNENTELTEFTIGNLVVELDGKFYTPPISCGLLAGTFREHLLETGQVMEKIVQLKDLKTCTNIFLVNSVRRWQDVELESIRDV